MTFNLRLAALRPLVVILALVMLVFATMAEAATCGAEMAPTETAEIAASAASNEASETEVEHDRDATPTDQHGVCAHGHCHHGSNVSDTARVDAMGHQLVSHASFATAQLPSAQGDLLKRPPRA